MGDCSRLKHIGIMLPCYNEKDNVAAIADEIAKLFEDTLLGYAYTIVFIDNDSTDGTKDELKALCKRNPNVRTIFNAKNFSYASTWHGIRNTPGDCVISIPSDFQVPVSTIPRLVAEWEAGHDVVCLLKSESKEKRFLWSVRQLFYKISIAFSDMETLPNMSGALYDRAFLNLCISMDDPLMYESLRACVCAYASNLAKVEFVQEERRSGKSKNRTFGLFQIALKRFTETSSLFPSLIFISGLLTVLLSLISLVVYVVLCICGILCSDYYLGALVHIILAFIGVLQIGLGVLGQYIMKIHFRTMGRPSVIESSRLNYE